jgi:hypothetical protein
MALLSKNNKKIYQIHIPKTGGLSITNELKDLGWSIDLWGKRDFPKYFNVPPQHMTAKQLSNFINVENIVTFTVIRDPWHRTISEFVWREKSVNFSDFDKWFSETFEILTTNPLQNHFVPQVKFILPNTYVFTFGNSRPLIDFIKKYEPNFQNKNNDNKLFTYKKPDFKEILSPSNQKIWEDYYADDIILWKDKTE